MLEPYHARRMFREKKAVMRARVRAHQACLCEKIRLQNLVHTTPFTTPLMMRICEGLKTKKKGRGNMGYFVPVYILVVRRKTCALLRAKTSALLRRKTCAVLRARTCALFRANTKETTKGGGRRPPPFVVAAEGRHLCSGSEQSTCPSSQHSTCLASQQGRCLGSQQGTCLASQH